MRAMGPHDLLALLYAHDTIFNVLLLFLFCLAIYVFDYPEGDNFKVARSSRRSLHRAPDASASAAAAKPAGSRPTAAAAAAAVVTGAGARAGAAAKRCAVDARRSGPRLARARPPARASRQLARHPAAPRFLMRPPTARFLLARHPPPAAPPPPLDLPRPRPRPLPAPALCAAPRPFAAPLAALESGDEATDR